MTRSRIIEHSNSADTPGNRNIVYSGRARRATGEVTRQPRGCDGHLNDQAADLEPSKIKDRKALLPTVCTTRTVADVRRKELQ
jgi:hypothetical protein